MVDLLLSPPSDGLRGTIQVPADKSISHRALILGAMAGGTTRITNHLHSDDVDATWRALEALGVAIRHEGRDVVVEGVGVRGFRAPTDPIYCGNSGTTMRILAGLLAGQSFQSVLTGDDSLSRRPMRRIIDPLRAMGASIEGLGGRPPIHIEGRKLHGCDHTLSVSSAQVKSCLLLAGLLADGTTRVVEPAPSRDHTERMLRHFAVCVDSQNGANVISGGQELTGRNLDVCGDISSAAFLLVGGLIVPNSEILLPGVGVNPTRTGALDLLAKMGACIEPCNHRETGGEPAADLRVKSSSLSGGDIGGSMVPRLIDEIPVLTVAATQAVGRTWVSDAAELRVKETDRIAALAFELRKMGASIEERPDGMVIDGPTPLRGAVCDSHGDHRIAMALAVAGLVADGETVVRDTDCVDVSYPGFEQALILAAGPQGS